MVHTSPTFSLHCEAPGSLGLRDENTSVGRGVGLRLGLELGMELGIELGTEETVELEPTGLELG